MIRLLVILIFISIQSAFAALPIDIVFDIDQTIATLIHDGPGGDLLADPGNPARGSISIHFKDYKYESQNKVLKGSAFEKSESYRIYDGLTELMEKLKAEQELGHVRVSFFSGGTPARNQSLLSSIKLKDGSSLFDLAGTGDRVFGRDQMTNMGVEGKIRDRFKKDLTKVNPDLSDVILIDDIENFSMPDQASHVLWLDDRFPYPERISGVDAVEDIIKANPRILKQEKNKMFWIADVLGEAIDRRLKSKESFAKLIQSITEHRKITPLSENQTRRFTRGQDFLNPDSSRCGPKTIANTLEILLQ